MNEEIKQTLFKKIIQQQREARDFAKFMISNYTDKDVSYFISTKIVITGGKFQPVTEIKELPEVRVFDGKATDNELSVKTMVIDNPGG